MRGNSQGGDAGSKGSGTRTVEGGINGRALETKSSDREVGTEGRLHLRRALGITYITSGAPYVQISSYGHFLSRTP